MVDFGQFPARLPESFGVAGLLHEKCKVYYDNIFSARHIGRVSDLLTARLKELGPDELRFRIIMMFSLYEAYRGHLRALQRPAGESLPEPLLIECGIDAEKIAVGVSFAYLEDELKDPAGLPARISAGAVTSRLEGLVAQMFADANQVVVRVEPESHRVEVVSVIGIPGKIDPAQLQLRRPVQVIVLKPESKIADVQAEYIELGDLDYNKLLQEDGPGAPVNKPATGEILARGAEDWEEGARIKGAQAAKETVTLISGVTEHRNDELMEARGSATFDSRREASAKTTKELFEEREEAIDDVSEEGSEADLERAKKKLELYRERIIQLQSKIEQLESKRQNEKIVVRGKADSGERSEAQTVEASSEAGSPGDEARTTESQSKKNVSITEIIKSFFSRKKDKVAESAKQSVADRSPEAPAAEGESAIPEDLIDPVTGKILREQVERLEATIEKMRREAQHLKNDGANARAQKWAEGMVGELLAEKARIKEMAKRLNVSSRQKELEFRNRETMLREELRRKEEQLKQKNYALDRSREQISQMNITLERSRSQHQGGGEEGQLRQKLAFTQKLLQGAKDESAAYARKVEELKDQLMVAQSAQASKPRGMTEDIATLKSKHDRLVKQNEEFKRANQLLAEKLNEIQKPKPGSMSNDELKKKLETAMRLAANYQRDSDQLRLKVEELQKEEARLKGELNRANNTVRALKASAAARGQKIDDEGGSGGNQAA